MDNQVLNGAVDWFDPAKGFGFLKRDDGEPDVFCHYTGIDSTGFKTLTKGDRVTFLVEQGRQGLQAACVKKVT